MPPKVIVITGASSGIGAALAQQLGTSGHSLVLGARRGDLLSTVAASAGTAIPVVTDVRRREDVDHLRDEAFRRFGAVDIWINNAGRGISRPALELADNDIDEMMAINLKSALYGMQAIIPHFTERGHGHIINVSSVLGRVPLASVRSAYSAAKAALNSLTANVRMDLRRTHPGIHVTLVMPGLVSTDFARSVLGLTGAPPPAYGGAPPPALRPQTPDAVAAAIVGAIDHPVAEVFTNPASAELVGEYYADVETFEAQAVQRQP